VGEQLRGQGEAVRREAEGRTWDGEESLKCATRVRGIEEQKY
jgi:hypothetical protein